MELFKLFFLGACIGVIVNVLWVIYYQIPRMMGRIVDLEGKYRSLHDYHCDLYSNTWAQYEDLHQASLDMYQQLLDITKDQQQVLERLKESND